MLGYGEGDAPTVQEVLSDDVAPLGLALRKVEIRFLGRLCATYFSSHLISRDEGRQGHVSVVQRPRGLEALPSSVPESLRGGTEGEAVHGTHVGGEGLPVEAEGTNKLIITGRYKLTTHRLEFKKQPLG